MLGLNSLTSLAFPILLVAIEFAYQSKINEIKAVRDFLLFVRNGASAVGAELGIFYWGDKCKNFLFCGGKSNFYKLNI